MTFISVTVLSPSSWVTHPGSLHPQDLPLSLSHRGTSRAPLSPSSVTLMIGNL